MDFNLIEKSGVFAKLWEISPILFIIFFISLIIIMGLSTLIVIAKANPGLFNNIIGNRKEKDLEVPKKHKLSFRPCPAHTELRDMIQSNSENIEAVLQRIGKIEEHQDENWLRGLRHDFNSPFMPEADRLLAGLTYCWWIEKKGLKNGDTRNQVIKMATEKKSLYHMATKQDSKLQLREMEGL